MRPCFAQPPLGAAVDQRRNDGATGVGDQLKADDAYIVVPIIREQQSVV